MFLFGGYKFYCNFARSIMVDVAQQVRASDCGSEGRGFEPHLPPGKAASLSGFFFSLKSGFLFFIEKIEL